MDNAVLTEYYYNCSSTYIYYNWTYLAPDDNAVLTEYYYNCSSTYIYYNWTHLAPDGQCSINWILLQL